MRSFRRQLALFWNWLRLSRDVTVMPEGAWRMRTAESVVFTPWPPGPVARNTCTSQSRATSSKLCAAHAANTLYVGFSSSI